MTTPKTTPGPWKVRAAHFCEDGIPAYEVVMAGEPNINACDARLIAAAPDLYDALSDLVQLAEQAMRDAGRDGCEYDDEAELKAARAALQRAEQG